MPSLLTSGAMGMISVADYGAVGTASGDQGPAFNQWIAALNAAGSCTGYIPAGWYRIATSLDPITSTDVYVVGSNQRGSVLQLVGGINGLYWSQSQTQGGIEKVWIQGMDTTGTKIGLRVDDASMFTIRDVRIDVNGNASTGLLYRGREIPYIRGLRITAPLPIHVQQNPNHPNLTMDYAMWTNIAITGGGLSGINHPTGGAPSACIWFDSNVTFSGFDLSNSVMAGGAYGIYCVQTAPFPLMPGGLDGGWFNTKVSLRNVRHEQSRHLGGTSFHFDFGTYGSGGGYDIARDFLFENCEVSAETTGTAAYVLKNIRNVKMVNCDHLWSGTRWLTTSDVFSLETDNCFIAAGATTSGLDESGTTGLKMVSATGGIADTNMIGGKSQFPLSARWIRQTEASALDWSAHRIGPTLGKPGGYAIARTFRLNHGESMRLPMNSDRGTEWGQVFIAATRYANAGDVHHGWFALTNNMDSGSVTKGVALLTGSASMSNTNTAGKLCLYATPGVLEALTLKNDLGSGHDVRVSLLAHVSRSSEGA